MTILLRKHGLLHRGLVLLLWFAPAAFLWPLFGPGVRESFGPFGGTGGQVARIFAFSIFCFIYYEFLLPEFEGFLHNMRAPGEKKREEFLRRCLNVSTGGEIVKETVDRLAAQLGTFHVVAVHYDSSGQPVVTGGGSEYERFLLRPQSLPRGPVRTARDILQTHPDLYTFMEEHAMKSLLPIRHADHLLAVFFLGEGRTEGGDTETLGTALDIVPALAGVFYRNRLAFIRQRRKALAEELQEAEYRKDLLLSNVSHEMKTPLTTILGMVEILLYAWIDDESANAEYFRIVALEARRLKELLEDLEIAAGITPREDPTSLQIKSMLKTKLGRLSHLIEERGMKVQWRLDLPNDRPGRNARLYLPVMIRHLLSNAIRFNNTGQATIQIAGRQDERTNLLELVIRDNGPGIELDQLKHVTDPFYRVDSELTYEVPGIGLGLYLVKTLARKLGGSFQIQSDAGQGTVVTLGLPLYSEGDNLRVYEDLERMRVTFQSLGLHLHVTDSNNRSRPEQETGELQWSGEVSGPAGPAFHASIYGQARPEILTLARHSLEILARMDYRESELEDLSDEMGYNYEELALLSGLTERLAMLEDARTAIDAAVSEAAELVNFNRAFLAEFSGKDLLHLTWSTSARDRTGRELPPDMTALCRNALDQGQNIQEEMDRSLLVILPLLPYSERPAVIVFERFNLKNAFTTIDISFLDAVAVQLAGKLQNLRYTEQEKYLRRVFQRFTPPRVVESVMSKNETAPLASRHTGAILYADFSDFSVLADEMAPEEAIELLDEFLGYMTAPLREENGSVENFTGNGLLAMFFPDLGLENLIVRAVRAALKMQTNRVNFSRARAAQDRPTFMAGIGIHFGTGLIGETGTDRARYSTVIGEAVQIAARLAHRAVRTEAGILVTEPVYRECRDFFTFQNTEYNIREIPGSLYRAFVPGADPGHEAPIRLF